MACFTLVPTARRAMLCGALLGGAVPGGTAGAWATEGPVHGTLLVHYLPGIDVSSDGVPRVPMAERVARWLSEAGLRDRWEPVPLKRSLYELQVNAEPVCVLGAFRTPERERFAQFSAPIHLEEPQVFIAQAAVAVRLRAHGEARKALNDPSLRLLIYDGVSYGIELDRWIAERPTAPLRAHAGRARALDMLARGRADWMIGTTDELRNMLASGPAAAALRFEAVRLPGMPPPVTRHLACSQRVPVDWMERIDRAIKARPL